MTRRILMGALLVLCVSAQIPQPPKAAAETEDKDDADLTTQLAKVKRVYVDLLSGGESSVRIRDLLMASLQASRVFIVTEDEEKADAVLKGTGEDSVFNQSFSSNEGINMHTQISLPGTASGTANQARYSDRTNASVGVGETDSRHSEERKHEAVATIRLVSKDGDVLWSTTQESNGGKFLGAAADVADKVAKKLVADMKRARREAAARASKRGATDGTGYYSSHCYVQINPSSAEHHGAARIVHVGGFRTKAAKPGGRDIGNDQRKNGLDSILGSVHARAQDFRRLGAIRPGLANGRERRYGSDHLGRFDDQRAQGAGGQVLPVHVYQARPVGVDRE